MARWLFAYALDRALIAFALYLAYLAWGEPLQQPMRHFFSADGLMSPYATILKALD